MTNSLFFLYFPLVYLLLRTGNKIQYFIFHFKVVEKLDEEYHKHAADTAQGDDVTYMLEKERERLQIQVYNNKKMHD